MSAQETVEAVSAVERSVKPEKHSWQAIGIDLAHLCGLDRWPGGLWREPWFVATILSAVPFWIGLWSIHPDSPGIWNHEQAILFLSLVVWQPVIEELAFRGFLQGVFLQQAAHRSFLGPVTLANLLASVTFALAHLPTNPLVWIVGIFVVSLGLGYARDRSDSLYPSVGLHCYFNAGYFLVTGPL